MFHAGGHDINARGIAAIHGFSGACAEDDVGKSLLPRKPKQQFSQLAGEQNLPAFIFACDGHLGGGATERVYRQLSVIEDKKSPRTILVHGDW